MKSKEIAILLATYNGGKFLKEQIDSLYAQSRKDWTLYIHDDGSTDNTPDIIKKYAQEHDNVVILDYPSQHGAKDNFFSMVDAVDASYYFFCDQDDKWLDNKIKTEMARMEQLERMNPESPIMVFSDVFVADEKLNIINRSLWKMSGAHIDFLATFEECGATPFVTGCTMLINRKAKETIIHPTDKATMHDAWITLCTLKAGGIISAVREPLLYYRQHGKNSLGASDESKRDWKYKLRNIKRIIKCDIAHWQMLKALGYGSIFKHIRYKFIYKKKCKIADRTKL